MTTVFRVGMVGAILVVVVEAGAGVVDVDDVVVLVVVTCGATAMVVGGVAAVVAGEVGSGAADLGAQALPSRASDTTAAQTLVRSTTTIA